MPQGRTRSDPAQRLIAETEKLERALHLHLEPMYADNNAWSLTAWEMEHLAEEQLPPRYMAAVKTLRQNLYAYIASLGAEWPAEEENNILLSGTYIEAAKALKALWLSLHLAYMAPLQAHHGTSRPEDYYPILQRYTRILAEASRLKPVPFKLADRLLSAASLTALLAGIVYPEHFESLGVAVLVADMLWLLAQAMNPTA